MTYYSDIIKHIFYSNINTQQIPSYKHMMKSYYQLWKYFINFYLEVTTEWRIKLHLTSSKIRLLHCLQRKIIKQMLEIDQPKLGNSWIEILRLGWLLIWNLFQLPTTLISIISSARTTFKWIYIALNLNAWY